MKFGENFAFYRKKLDITQEQAAERLFVSRQTVSRWENGAMVPDVETLIRICELFECDMDSLLRKDASDVYDNTGKEEKHHKLTEYNENYDKHMNRSSFFIAFGVALILIGVTLLLFLGAYPALELLAVILLFGFIFSAVAIFIFFGIEHSAFMRENPHILPYPKEMVKAFSKKLPWYIIIATGLIVSGLIFIIITNYDDNSIPSGIGKTVWEHITVGIFLSLVTIAVFLYVLGGMLYSKYNVNEYNEDCIKEGFVVTDFTNSSKKDKKIVGGICTAIMLTATALFLLSSFIFDGWRYAGIIFAVGALCCGIFAVLYDAFKK